MSFSFGGKQGVQVLKFGKVRLGKLGRNDQSVQHAEEIPFKIV